jgi:hypothetical protein
VAGELRKRNLTIPVNLTTSRHPIRRAARWIAPGVVFAAFVVALSYRVMPHDGAVIYGDNPYFWPNRSFDGFSVVQTSFGGFTRLVGMQTAFLTQLPRLLSAVLSDAWSSYLLTYGLVFGTCLTYYIVAYKLTGSRAIGYLAGLFIILNSVTLEYLVIQPSHIFAALIIYALTFYLLMRVRGRFRLRHAVLLAVLSLGLTHPFLWMLQVVLLLGLFLFLILHEREHMLGNALRTLGLIVLASAFWLIPFVVGSARSATADIYAGNQASVFEGIRGKIQYVEAFQLFQYPGTWQEAAYDGRIPYYVHFGGLAFAVGVFLFRGRRGIPRRFFLLLLGLFVIAVTLGLGPNSALTGSLWQFAYERLPGFGFFRTFSRFLNLALVALVFLVVYAFDQLRRDRFRYYPHLLGFFLLVLLASHLPFFTGDLNGTITAAHVPKEYAALNANLDTAGSFPVMTFPNIEYEAYEWNANRNQRIFQQIAYFKEFFLDQPVIFNRAAFHDLNITNDYFPRLLAYDDRFTLYSEFDEELNRLGVKYVLVHKDLFDIRAVIEGLPYLRTNEELSEAAVVPFQRYTDYFSGNPRYRLLSDNSVFTLFENTSFQPILRTEEASFQKINDATYRVYLSNLDAERALALLQRFDRGWLIYPQRDPSARWCRPISSHSDSLTECAPAQSGHDLGAVTRVVPGQTLSVPHTETLGYANQWHIEASSFRDQFSEEYYSSNPDGSIDIELLIYFQPQSYFYLGLIITLVTLAGALAFLVWSSARRRRVEGLWPWKAESARQLFDVPHRAKEN